VNLQNIPNKEMNIKELEQVNGGNDNRQIDMPCVPNPRPIYPFDPVRCAIKHN